MRLNHAEIAALIPHAGTMCLLDAVTDWDEHAIACTATPGPVARHPLAHEGRLATISLIEYGAQAAAVHGALLARAGGASAMAGGLLVAVRDVTLAGEAVPGDVVGLSIRAERRTGGVAGSVYRFRVAIDGAVAAAGRLTVAAGGPHAVAYTTSR